MGAADRHRPRLAPEGDRLRPAGDARGAAPAPGRAPDRRPAARGGGGPRGVPAPGLRAHARRRVLREARAAAAGRPRRARRSGRAAHRAPAWDDLAGMADTKALIERRVVLPLAGAELAASHGVTPPKAIVLFGPPGTGKTSFAKAAAGRLGWPFVELFPSRLAAEGPGGRAAALREFFELVHDVEHLVLFIDEVEEIAGAARRAPRDRGRDERPAQGHPAFRSREHRLLVCATNSVRDLDPALLRPGRFDYVLPIGPPDPVARAALWTRFVQAVTSEPIEVDALVAPDRPVHPRRHRVRRPQGGPGGVRAGGLRGRSLAGGGERLPGRRGRHPAHPHPGARPRLRGGHRALRARLARFGFAG